MILNVSDALVHYISMRLMRMKHEEIYVQRLREGMW